MNKDELEGKAKDIAGRAKEGVGEATGDTRLHDEGAADQAEGRAQESWGRAKRKVGDAVEDAGDRLKK